ADQRLQRLRGGFHAERFGPAARRAGERLFIIFGGRQAELPRQLRIEHGNGRRRAVIGLRRFVEAFVPLRILHPSPLRGGVGCGGDVFRGAAWPTPLPNPPPQGGRERSVTRSPIALRHILAFFPRRGAGAVRGRLSAGAAVEGIIRRRFQPGGG